MFEFTSIMSAHAHISHDNPEGKTPMPMIAAPDNAILEDAQVDFWAGRVRAFMRKTFTGVLETGKILIHAQAALPHGQWLPILEKAGLKPRTAALAAWYPTSEAAHRKETS
jgi:hypothetical protein